MEPNHDNDLSKELKKRSLGTLERRIEGGYEVPNEYFDQLKAKVMASVGDTKKETSWRDTIKSAAGFVAGFAAMVLFAVGVVNLTPDEAVKQLADSKVDNEQLEMDEFMMLYQVSEDDVLEYVFPNHENPNNSVLSETTVIDYVQFFGGVDNY